MIGKNNVLPAPANAAVQKLRNSAEYQALKTEMLKSFGSKTLDVVQAEISKKDLKKEAQAIAIDERDEWMDAKRAARQKKEDARLEKKALKKYDQDALNQMTSEEKQAIVDQYKEKHNTKINKLGQIIRSIPFGVADSVRSAVMLNDFKKHAEKAMLDTGRIEAGKMAVKNYRELKGLQIPDTNPDGSIKKNDKDETIYRRVKNKDLREGTLAQVKGELAVKDAEGKGDESHFVDRVRNKAAGDKGEFFKDKKVSLKEKTSMEYGNEKSQLKSMYADYMLEVVKASASESGDVTIERARKAFEERLKKADFNKDKAHYDNHQELLKQIEDDYRGQYEKELGGDNVSPEKHQAAVDAIDEYLSDRLNLMSGRINTGLDMKLSAERAADKATVKYGVVIGSAVSLATTMAKGLSRSEALKVFDTASGALAGKMILGGVFGGIAGYIKKRQGQRYEEMRQAIGKKEQGEDDKSHYEKISVSDTIKEMQALRKEIDDGKNLAENRQKLLDKLGDLRARASLEEKQKIALMSFESRESIEKQRYELVEEARAARKALEIHEAHGVLVTDLVAATERATNSILAKNKQVDKAKHKERLESAALGAIVGASAAFVATLASDRIFHGGQNTAKIITEFKEFYGGSSDVAANIAEGGAAAAATGATIKAAETLDDTGGINVSKGDGYEDLPKIEIDNKAEVLEYKSGAAVLIENDPQGGTAVGFDNNGNGVLDSGEYLRGEGDAHGINLANASEYESLREELKENYNLDLQREAIDATKYNQIEVSNYMESVDNKVTVKDVIFDTDSHEVSLGVPVADPEIDGMTQYVVPVDGAPDGSKLFIDLDGNGKGNILVFDIRDGKAIVSADVVDTSTVGNNGVANFLGRATVGRMDGDTMVSYTEAVNGVPLGSTDSLTASVTEKGYAFTVINGEGETVSDFAVNTQGRVISNVSEIFNGIGVGESGRLPAGFSAVEGIEDHGALASGEKLPDVGNWKGGYNSQYDSSLNYPFKNNNHSLVGTPMTWDADGNGVMNATEEASYIKQMFVRTATNPYVLGQNASNYGLLEPDALAKNLFNGDANAMAETLEAWGVSDGVIDSERELQNVLDHLKMPENADYYDKLVNSTIHEMQDQLAGGGFEQGELTERISTYINKDGSIDTKGNASMRIALYPYKTDPVTGEKVYVGNKGWWVRKYYGKEGGKVADLPMCEQKAVVVEEEIVTTTPERIITTTTKPRIITTTTTPERIVTTTTTPERIITTTTKPRIITTTTTPERIVTTTTPERIVTTTTPERIVTTTTPERIVTTTTPERIVTTTTPERIVTTTTPERIVTTTTPERIVTTTTPERIVTTTTPERIVTTTTPERIVTTTTPERIVTTTTPIRTGKDVERRAEIDKEILEETAKDYNTEKVEFGPADEVTTENLTEETTENSTFGTTAETVEHDNSLLYGNSEDNGGVGTGGSGETDVDSGTTETYEGPTDIAETLSEEHDYSQDLGGANFDAEKADELVPADVEAQNAANAAAAATETGEIKTMDDYDDDYWAQFGL